MGAGLLRAPGVLKLTTVGHAVMALSPHGSRAIRCPCACAPKTALMSFLVFVLAVQNYALFNIVNHAFVRKSFPNDVHLIVIQIKFYSQRNVGLHYGLRL